MGALYPGYEAIFMFNNAKSYAIFAKDALHVGSMSKDTSGVQPFLCNGWYEKKRVGYQQSMSFIESDEAGQTTLVPKRVQHVLQKRGIWPETGLKLECPKPKCKACIDMAKCKSCTKAQRCDSCREKKFHSSFQCTAQRRCNACVLQRNNCTCTVKLFGERCKQKQGLKCEDCNDLPERHEKIGE